MSEKQYRTLNRHKTALIERFPFIAKQFSLTESGQPEGIVTLSLLSKSAELERTKRAEALSKNLLEFIPIAFNRYASDLLILQRKDPGAQLLGVSYDKTTDTLISPPVRFHEVIYDQHPLGGSLGRRLSRNVGVISEMSMTIQKVLLEDSQSDADAVYHTKIIRHTPYYEDNPDIAWSEGDGQLATEIVTDPSHQQIFPHTSLGEPASLQYLQLSLDVLQKAFI